MKIWVNNLPDWEDEIRETARRVIEGENLDGELSITFINDDEMVKLNKKYKDRNDTTDVLSFPFDIPQILGDIYISREQADRQKKRSLLKELKLLTVHGILHLAGYKDSTEVEREEMRSKEAKYMEE